LDLRAFATRISSLNCRDSNVEVADSEMLVAIIGPK